MVKRTLKDRRRLLIISVKTKIKKLVPLSTALTITFCAKMCTLFQGVKTASIHQRTVCHRSSDSRIRVSIDYFAGTVIHQSCQQCAVT